MAAFVSDTGSHRARSARARITAFRKCVGLALSYGARVVKNVPRIANGTAAIKIRESPSKWKIFPGSTMNLQLNEGPQKFAHDRIRPEARSRLSLAVLPI